jgi:hypothetical protein
LPTRPAGVSAITRVARTVLLGKNFAERNCSSALIRRTMRNCRNGRIIMQQLEYLCPKTLDECLRALQQAGDSALPMRAGRT